MSSNNQIQVKQDVFDIVAAKIRHFQQSGELQLPPDYSAANAIKSALLILQDAVDRNKRPVLESCTKNSVASALLAMCTQGLNPAKNQVYFIPYGNKLTCQRSYFGSMAVAKRVDPSIESIDAEVIYAGDTVKYEIIRGKKIITKHEQDFMNIDKSKIVGAYCVVMGIGGEIKNTVLMTIDEIKQAWKQSKMNPVDDRGNIKSSGTHGKFTADMAMKTVINRACKTIINSSSDASILGKVIAEQEAITVIEQVDEQAALEANSTMLDFDDAPTEPVPVAQEERKTQPEETTNPAVTTPEPDPVDFF